MFNQVQLIGNVGRDPEMKYMPNGDAVVNIAVATSEKWKDKNTGEQKEHTEWHRVNAFGKLAEIIGQYVKKGSKVFIQGKLKTRKYTDKDGIEKYVTEIQADTLKMLDGKPAEGGQGAPAQRPAAAPAQRPQQGGAQRPAPNFSDMDDDIPFAFDSTLLSSHTTSSQLMRAKHGRGLNLARENAVEF